MKKLLGIMALMPLLALADTEIVDGVEWSYVVINGQVQVGTGYQGWAVPYTTTGAIKIPDVLGGLPVTSIGMYAFEGRSELTSVTIPLSVTRIGSYAFSCCSGLTSVTIPEGVTHIEGGTFSRCSGLTSITIPSGVTSIEEHAFYMCSELTSVKIPLSVTSIHSKAFDRCDKIRSATLPSCGLSLATIFPHSYQTIGEVSLCDGETSIGMSMFAECSGLTSVTIPPSVAHIRESAFEKCKSLKSVMISDLSAWCRIAFADSLSNPLSNSSSGRDVKLVLNGVEVTNLTIPPDVEGVGDYAFYAGGGLVSVTIPPSVTKIGNSAFCRCDGLTSVSIPSSVTSIGDSAFGGCRGLTSASVPSSVMMHVGERAFSGCDGLADSDGFVIVNGVLYDYVGGATSVTIPSGVTEIGTSAFTSNDNLTSVTIPASVTRIGNRAFWSCDNLTAMEIPMSVTHIGEEAFYYCSGLSSVMLPASVTHIGCNAFKWTPFYDELSSGLVVLGGVAYKYKGMCPENVTIPPGVVSIGDEAFYECSGLKSVMIPPSVTSIGKRAFYSCSGMTTMTIPAGVTNIGEEAFYNCGKLPSVVIPDGVTSIEDSVFACCYGLTAVIVPSNVTSIGASAFRRCTQIKSVAIPPSVTSIGDEAFSECWSLTSVDIPSGVGKIGRESFWCCYALMSVTIPEGVTNIGQKAFYKCDRITSVTIPPSVKSIGNVSFYYCNGLDIVYVANGDVERVKGLCDWAQRVKFVEIPDVAEAAGDGGREWKSSGDAEWFVAWNDERGKYVARSGGIGNSQTSILETVVENGGTVSFAVLTSCEEAYRGRVRTDGLSFAVDGQEVLWLDGENGWTNVSWMVKGDGEHRLQWRYGKDSESAGGNDCACLSEFNFLQEVVVRFEGGGAEVGDVPDPMSSYRGAEIILPSNGVLHKKKHDFVGWSDGTNTYQAGETYVLGDGAPVFTAQWAAKRLPSPVISVAASYATEKTTVTISAETGTVVRYTLDGLEPTMTSLSYESPFEVAGSMSIKAVAFRDDWFDSPVAIATTVRMPWTYGECLNSEKLGFSCEDKEKWTRDMSITHDGVAALRSGEIGHNATSRIELVVSGDGELSFWWKASTEVYRGYPMDYGVLTVDGAEIADIYGEADWTRKTIVLSGDTVHTVRWEFRKDEADDPQMIGEDCIWLDEVWWSPSGQFIENDPGAAVTGDPETGFVVKPSEGKTTVEVTIPQGVDPAKVTVEVSPKVSSVKLNGAKVKIVSGGADITEFLNVPAEDGTGAVDLTKATVKDEIVKEAMDVKKGAVIDLSGGSLGTTSPTITTAPTRIGLVYTFREGTTLEGFSTKVPSATKPGDGTKWSPEIKVKGGNSAFYSIDVGKGE